MKWKYKLVQTKFNVSFEHSTSALYIWQNVNNNIHVNEQGTFWKPINFELEEIRYSF